MKCLSVSFSILFSFVLIVNAQVNQDAPSVLHQMENLNSYWKGKQIQEPILKEKTFLPDDVSLIQTHLSLVEKTLREKDTKNLSAEQQYNRNQCLNILHDYRLNGVFPKNTHHAARTPYFIDNFGTACAVGQLIVSTGYESVAQKIRSGNNYAYISELNQQYPELQLWADAYGFEIDELAWIQPGYCFNPCVGYIRNVSCYGVNDGCIGTYPDMTGVGVSPYVYQEQMWNGNQWGQPPMFSSGLCDLPAGLYRHLVIDAVSDSFSFEYTLTQPDSISIAISSTDDAGGCHGTAFAQASGGVPPYSYLWSTGDTTQSIADACFGTYSLTVTDSNDCEKYASIIVTSISTPTASVTHGPIIGGVTPTIARVFVRTDSVATVAIQFSTDNTFSSIAKTVSGQTLAARDSSNIFNATGLAPDTRYHVRVLINGTESGNRSSFKTFPQAGQPGHYKFLFGSCQYELSDFDSSLFVQMKTEDANIYTPTGDWGYPDKDDGTNDLYLANPPTSWAVDYNKISAIYKERYASSNSAFFIRNIAMDYTHDDHDYLNDNSAREAANIFEINPFGGNFGEPKVASQPPQARLNLLQAYREIFPSYSLVDSTEGIFHSYVMGNCEVFVLDTRSARSPQHAAIVESGGEWMIQEPAGHSLLGQIQMNWLLNGLLNSTADWKIIVSSVTFNAGYKAVMDSLFSIGKGSSPILGADVGGIYISTGLLGASQMSDLWLGFPSDQQALLDLVETNNLKNIFIVSGDAHSAALDDGTNSGIPELMSANLKKSNSQDPLILSNFIGYPLWNKGASGMGNQNFNSTYGKVEVFGSDSVRLSAVDADGVEVCGHTFNYESADTNTSVAPVASKEKFKVFPNPSSDKLFVETTNPEQQFYFILISPEGKEISRKFFSGKGELDLSGLPNGNYLYRILNEKYLHLSSGVVSVIKH